MAPGTGTPPHDLRFDAGRICLDLLATSHPGERLDTVAPLCAWITAAGLVPPGTPLAHADPGWPHAFRELRFDVSRLVRGWLVRDLRPDERALARVNDLARTAPPALRAVYGEGGVLAGTLDRPPECAALLAALARDAVELLTDASARARLRQCEGDNCPLVYVDTSRGRRRRWCSSGACGNRERVARHRRRAALAQA